MPSVRLLHASDLHIAEVEKLRSPLDHLKDLNKFFSISFTGLRSKIATVRAIRRDIRDRMASSFDSETLLCLAEFIYENAKRKIVADKQVEDSGEKLDAVILTGDLATTGEYEDIEKTAFFLYANFNRQLPFKADDAEYRDATLSAISIPVIVLPGNHDRYEETDEWRKRWPIIFNPGSTNFDDAIMNYAGPEKPIYTTLLLASLPNGKELIVAVLCADFSLQNIEHCKGRLGWLAQGFVYEDIRDRLASETAALKKATTNNQILSIVWAIHFPPYFPKVKRNSKLLDEETLIPLANQLGVDVILSGHTHRQLDYRGPGMNSRGLCCGTTTQYEPQVLPGGKKYGNVAAGNHFQILTFTVDDKLAVHISTEDYRYAASAAGGGPSLKNWERVGETHKSL